MQPGIVLDVLNAKLAVYGLQFASDPATSNRATIGGMMGNNSAGTKSLLYGMTRDHVSSCRFLLADGTMLELKELSPEEYRKKLEGFGAGAREAEIYSKFKKIIDVNRDEITAHFPKIDAGFLTDAKKEGEKTLRELDDFIQRDITVVVCEPGCWSALVDDLPDLIDDETLCARIKQNVMMIDDFIAEKIKSGSITCGFSSPFDSIIIHLHSHRQALSGADSMKYVLDHVPGMNAELLDAGCCGNVGFYGYARGHRELSMKIGEERFFPAILKRSPETAVVACGLDCRMQIADATGVRAVHWVDTLCGTVV